MADYYAEMIEFNASNMMSNANWLRAALLIIFLTLVAGAGAGLLAS